MSRNLRSCRHCCCGSLRPQITSAFRLIMALHADKANDVATASNFKQVVTRHLHLDIDVDFESKRILGQVKLSLDTLADKLESVVLDVHEALEIEGVKIQNKSGTSKDAKFKVVSFAKYGKALVITLPDSFTKGDKFDTVIDFVTSPGPAVCWMDPAQTADKKYPLMYTQGQAILNRSFFPCQDTPMVKAPYSAFVNVADNFTALMSAPRMSRGEKANRNGVKECFFFEQDVPVQVYLVALAVGDFVSAEVGPRSKVWSERSLVDKAQAEFNGEIEKFLQAGEQLFGNYVWTRYDILIMPPSFPFGGMENPCLTFVTPCIVVGDKSLIDVVIHEISHSWFGNLVSIANWGEFWLNEGFTMYAQRRIQDKIYGRPFSALETATGQSLLHSQIDLDGTDHPLTKLRVVIDEGVDPEDTYNETPYEKGFCFVSYLCSLTGDVEKFDDFLKAYVEQFKFKSIVSEDLFDFFFSYFPKLKEEKVDEKRGFEFVKTWLDKPGRPVFTPDLSDKDRLTAEADEVAEIMSDGRRKGSEAKDISGWQTYQIMYFLDILSRNSPLPDGCMQKLAATYPQLAKSQNAEITLRWCEIVIKNDASEHFDNVRNFLKSQGKQKYTKPLYVLMARGTDRARHLGASVFRETRDALHVQVRQYVAEILEEAGILV
ncbi:aminopeptidase B [Aplysia californica]|uniref:Aminopeptidase B n=1 Tax=Aplysia californica TaxID=6500 RepID=A0ABM1W272_APLCA|nr:aminopeptidase B [Aplysia californica]